MSLEPPELAALRRALGQQLVAARHVAEVGQQQLARKTGYSRSSIAHAEAGRQFLTRAFWQTADELLKADGALLTSYEQLQAAQQDHERQKREAELAEAYAAVQAQRAERAAAALATPCPDPARHANGLALTIGQDALASAVTAAGAALAEGLTGPLVCLAFLSSAAPAVSAEWGGHLHEQLGQFLHGWANTMERRELLKLLGWTAATVVASPVVRSLDTDERERVAQAVARPSRHRYRHSSPGRTPSS